MGLLKKIAARIEESGKERERKREIFKKEYNRMEPEYIKKKARAALKNKYSPKKRQYTGLSMVASSQSSDDFIMASLGLPARKKR